MKNRRSRSAGRKIERLRRPANEGWDSGRDVECCIAGVSACADFSFLRGVSSVIKQLLGFGSRITSYPDVGMQKSVDVCIVCRPANGGEISCSSRIGADKRFHIKMFADPPTLPVTGLLRCGLRCKDTHLFAFDKQIFGRISAHCLCSGLRGVRKWRMSGR